MFAVETFDIRYHYVRKIFEREDIDVKYVTTSEMNAEVLKKTLFGPTCRKCLIAYRLL